MALWKPFMGNRASLDAVEKHAGYVYFCVDDGSFHLDFLDAEGNVRRKQINANEANNLVGYDIVATLNSSDTEIPTSKAVFDSLSNKAESVHTHASTDIILTDTVTGQQYQLYMVDGKLTVALYGDTVQSAYEDGDEVAY